MLVTRESFIALLGSSLLRLLFLTLRLKVDDRCGLLSHPPKDPYILCFWHNRILAITFAYLRKYSHRQRKGVTVLTSPSRDGELLAQFVGRFRMGSVRGSSSRRGSQALRELVRLVEGGTDIAITPDGPRGPRYRLGPGVIHLAATTGALIVPLHATFSRCIRLKTWDGFIIPLPFSTISVTVDETIAVPRGLDAEAFEALRQRTETLLKNAAD